MQRAEEGAATRAMSLLVRQLHAGQTRNGGRVPYWVHVESVAELVGSALQRSGELAHDPALAADIFLAAQGHDLYEDTRADREAIRAQFGERVDQLIGWLTNPGSDSEPAPYLARMATAPEEARLIKLADLVDNTWSCAYGLHDLGVPWVLRVFLPIFRKTKEMLMQTGFANYRSAAGELLFALELAGERLESNLPKFASADNDSSQPKKEIEKNPTEGWDGQIDPDAYRKGMEKIRQKEEEERKKFPGGKPFPVPDKDSDSVLVDEPKKK